MEATGFLILLILIGALLGSLRTEDRSGRRGCVPKAPPPRIPKRVGMDAPPDCCSMMKFHLQHEDKTLEYWPKVREVVIPVRDGGTSGIVIDHCPWCGTRLPASLREGSPVVQGG